MNTELLYMKNMQEFTCAASIVEILNVGEKFTLILDQTIFYPQGGGQPYDTGIIKSVDKSLVFEVQEVRFAEGKVHHIGVVVSGTPLVEMKVLCEVNKKRREINTRLHSAGHLVDLALRELKITWIAGKGYHFPEGAYVEYQGDLNNFDLEKLKKDIEDKCNEIISRNIQTTLSFDYSVLKNCKPSRTVYYGDFGIPCGGTHVENLGDIGKITIRKIKKEKENIRVSYNVE